MMKRDIKRDRDLKKIKGGGENKCVLRHTFSLVLMGSVGLRLCCRTSAVETQQCKASYYKAITADVYSDYPGAAGQTRNRFLWWDQESGTHPLYL